MFGRKKIDDDPPKRRGADLMNQMGYTNMEQMENMLYGNVDDDEDLEAELMALQGENSTSNHSPMRQQRKKPAGGGLADIDKMAAECMRDIGSDEDVSDIDDADLMAELQDLSHDTDSPHPSQNSANSAAAPQIKKPEVNMVSLLEERLSMYSAAVDSAKAGGDASKARRLDRGIKTLQDLLKKAKANKPIPEDEIPPPVAIGGSSRSSSPANTPVTRPKETPAPQTSQSSSHLTVQPTTEPSKQQVSSADQEKRQMLITRRDQYKRAALEAKHAGDLKTAQSHVRISKQFDAVIQALDDGKEIDLTKMPPPPSAVSGGGAIQKVNTDPPNPKVQRSAMQAAGGSDTEPNISVPPPPSEEEEKKLFKAPDAPRSTLEALEQRLEKYRETEQESKNKGETSKVRRYGRIVKQYQDAIKAHKAGRPVDYEELPTPPGYAPIPTGGGSPAKAPAPPQPSQNVAAAAAAAATGGQKLQPPNQGPSPQKQRTPSPGRNPAPPQPKQAPQQTPPQRNSRSSLKKSPTSRAEQQAFFLTERMNEYKQAALKSKRENNIEMAKKYMRIAKGFEPMIEAAESGLPVDLSQIPPSLESEEELSFTMVEKEDVQLSGDRTEVFKKLEQDLIQQIRTCVTNHQHFTKLGDVVSAARFEKMEQGCRKELDALKNAFKHNDPVPKFHYENKTFSLVQCNTELGDSELQITIVRGIQYSMPEKYSEKDMDTYIKFEFPYPTEDPQTGQTETVKGTINPEYQQPFKLEINRKSRAFLRVVERKAAKCEIYYKRGFLKSDKLLGTANVKLQPLDSKCTVHDSYDLTDGRKTVGGKLEVKLRIRDPFKSKQVEEVKEKWLVIDQFIKTLDKNPPKNKAAPPPPKQAVNRSHGTTCMEVLKYEKQQLDFQISSLKDRLTQDQASALVHKSKLIQQKIDQQQAHLKQGGAETLKAYVRLVLDELPKFEEEARHLARLGDMQKAQVMLTKKKHAEKELSAIKAKYPTLFS